ncbi:glycoside hydrolase family 76 protein [Gordonia soli]|uniref:Fructose-bisphosphate aldolase n=1 Tax=Gordonia soli NBRC 108243 TaxID=1223545 RepID=M0QHB0_9ACTN|nr:glycoside hydrolase family 76 protein [Gordonia soli]GAC67918.1 hypothetical protein GS4_11_01870 [Gordonia soli NBRC 108243]
MGNASKSTPVPTSPNDRAAAAAAAVTDRHLHRLLGSPGTRIASVAWPKGPLRSRFGLWHYWWHAHLVDLLVDAAIHRADDDRSYDDATADVVNRLIRSIRIRNLGRWTNNYYDDMAWLGLAIERADRHLDLRHPRAQRALTGKMLDSWVPHLGGGIPWRTMDLFFNAPANGPAAILVARTGHTERAVAMADWIDATLIDPESHLVIDGVKPGGAGGQGGVERVTDIYTYCQGVVLGTELECLRATGDLRHLERIDRLLGAVEQHEAPGGVIRGAGGGDGGLFAGVLARYLALVATDLPDGVPDGDSIRHRAAAVVTASAEAVWANRAQTDDGPLFGADWSQPARVPAGEGSSATFVGGAVHSSAIPERDLSVQLSAWMALEAAAAVDLRLPEHDRNEAPWTPNRDRS